VHREAIRQATRLNLIEGGAGHYRRHPLRIQEFGRL
jgi:hypothetical protein